MSQFTNSRNLCMLKMTLLMAIVLITLVGCGSTKTVVRGRVITGTVGQATVTSPGDERFDEPGLPSMTVIVLAKGGSAARGRGVFAKVETDELGDFELVFPGGGFPRDAVEIRVSGEGIFTARSTTFMPSKGDQLLCVVIPRPGYVRPEPNREHEQ